MLLLRLLDIVYLAIKIATPTLVPLRRILFAGTMALCVNAIGDPLLLSSSQKRKTLRGREKRYEYRTCVYVCEVCVHVREAARGGRALGRETGIRDENRERVMS